jgi:energy-coupling factor transporter ATP-binding protein EcfA2
MTIDPIALKLAEIVLKWGWDKGTSQIEKINSSTPPTKEKIAQACKEYIDSYRHRYGKISVLRMPKPAELENIYTNVQIIEGQNLWRYESQQALEQAYRDSARRSYQSDKSKKKDGIEIANKHQYLMVLGQPGAGKSTFLKRIGLAALQGKEDRSLYRIQGNLPGLKPADVDKQQLLAGKIDPPQSELYFHELLPVLIELKRCDNEQIDLVGKIQAELETCGFESANILTQALLSKGGMLVLLDGLDEIPSQHLNRAITQIQDFVNKYKDNRFIISCRTAAYQGGFNNLVNVEIVDFDDEQIQQFINNWFCREQDLDVAVAESCWQLLNSDGYQSNKELAHTPLLLTFLCLVFDESQVFPKNRAALYKDALDILLRRWAAEKRIQRDPIYKDLTIQLEEMLLAKIAYEQFSQDRLFFDKQTVISEIQGYLAENLNAPQYLDGENVLRAIQIQQGILVGRSSDTLSFSHLTLQEYLTAQYIVDRQLIDELVFQHLADPRWREVFLLVAGLMRNGGDDLLKKMTIATSQLINTKNLRTLVNWAAETTESVNSKINYLARRNLALAIANANVNANANANANAYAIAIAYAIAYAIANAYANAIAIDNAIAYANAYAIAIAIVNAYAYAYAYANAYAIAIAIAIARSIELVDNLSELQIFDRLDYTDLKTKLQALEKQIPDDSQPESVYREFAKNILQVWCQSLRIERDWLDLSVPEIENLDRYFTANFLIMHCKEAAVYVSAKGWAEIEELMFRVIQLDDGW